MRQFLLLLATSLLFCTHSFSQVFKKVDPIICPSDPKSYDTFVPPSIKLIKNKENGRTESTFKSEIIVNYTGFTTKAEEAFQYAVDIWATLIESPVPIIIDANFADLGAGVLGSAGPTTLVSDFEGAPKAGVLYSIALADKIAGYSLNNPSSADISCSFSNSFNWYFGTDGNTPENQSDFVTVVLHELGHGLGFTTFRGFDDESGEGNYTLDAYNRNIELGDGTSLLTFDNPSVEIGDAFTGGDLFFNAPLSVSVLGERPQLYAPASFAGGSSVAHLDESTYPAGDVNSLMSPQVGSGEAIHDPGVALDMFADMGWVHTYLKHENIRITDNGIDPFSIELEISSDTILTTVEPVLVYSTDNFATSTELEMIDSGDGSLFTSEIPNPGLGEHVDYYFSGVTDVLGRSYVAPTEAPTNFYSIDILNYQTKALPYLASDGGSFEANQNDFQTVNLSGNVNFWELGVPGNVLDFSVSADNVWKTKLNENVGEPTSTVVNSLVSPIFDFSDDAKNHVLKFNYSMENAAAIVSGSDGTEFLSVFNTGPFGLNVEYSLDKGATWQLLGEKNDKRGENWYNRNNEESSVFPNSAPSGWIKQTIEVADGDTTFIAEPVSYNVSFLGGNPEVVFRLDFYVAKGFRDDGYEADGVLIDDFEILKGNPTADFITSSSGFEFPGTEIQFTYISAGATSYLWDFGDGTTSDQMNPSHIYTNGGTYTVSLTINSADGSDVVTKEDLINIISIKDIPYLAADGGDLESGNDFNIVNISGTGFEKGSSSITGKAGTASGNTAIVLGIDAQQYENDSEAFIFSPSFNFEGLGNYTFSFAANYSFEEGWDGFIIEYSLDEGLTWNHLDPEVKEGWYDVIGEDNPDAGWPAIPLFTGTTGDEYVTKSTDISFLGGEGSVSFRVNFRSDAAVVDVGMAIDDFEVFGPESGPAVIDFEFSGNDGCDGQEVTFLAVTDGTIEALDWDFGANATPSTAEGIGPHAVTFSSPSIVTDQVTLTAQSSVNGEVIVSKDIITAPLHVPDNFTVEYPSAFEALLTAPLGDGYQWLQEDVIIEGATERTLTVNEFNQDYSVLVDVGGCSVVSESQLIISSTNIDSHSQSILLYPNPVKEKLNVSLESRVGIQTIRIVNLQGKTLISENIEIELSKNSYSIDISELAAGIYNAQIMSEQGVKVLRFIVID